MMAGRTQRDLLVVTIKGSTSAQDITCSSMRFGWAGAHFCLFQMYMRDSLHQIDYGVIIHVLRGILRLFYGNNTL